MPDKRESGILLHVTSLPSNGGVGDIGPGAYRFIDFLVRAGQSLWQILPLNPSNPGEGNSPYSSSSAFAGNVLLISPELLFKQGWLKEMPTLSDYQNDSVDYGKEIDFKNRILADAYRTFEERHDKSDYEIFCRENSYWLDDYALFVSLRDLFEGQSWADWPVDIRDRKAEALEYYGDKLSGFVRKQKFSQFIFYEQWMELKKYADGHQIDIMGDIPIYMSYQSADLWSHPEIFKLDQDKKRQFVAGVPPDYFSETGQLWGNPVYNWDILRETGFEWWIRRIEHNLKLFDLMRIDHFRGLVGYWEIPSDRETAVDGQWVGVPSDEFFARLGERFPSLPLVAEDLGLITPDVKELIAKLGIPGMKVLLFAFGENLPTNPYAPHNHIKNCIVYTGTHDNNTARGWYENEATTAEKESLRRYVGHDINAEEVYDILLRLAMMSVADTIIIPIQDIIGLGAEARMNIPSKASGNWEWRLKPEYLTDSLAQNLFDMTEIYGRLPRRERD